MQIMNISRIKSNLRCGSELGPFLVLGDVVQERIVLDGLVGDHGEPERGQFMIK